MNDENQESTIRPTTRKTTSDTTQRTSDRSIKETITFKKFENEDFSKKLRQIRMTKIAQSIDFNDKDESRTV
jgi:hypothetical protein